MSTTTPATSLPHPTRRAGRLHLDIPARAVSAGPLAALLVVTGVLYLWGLSKNGSANEYYAAAVQAGTHSWKAFLFGSLDAANYITVDKPPASLWLMELSTRVLGFSSFSMLLPQALEGVAAVALLYAIVRRSFGRSAALLSGLVLALTPVAALMFRFNNPDALLVLLLIAGAYCVTRALERGQTRWIALAGAALGLAFLTKMMQAFVVLPAFALVYLVAAPVPLRRRVRQLALAGVALVAAAGWWVGLVELWPASARPYIGGSTNNSVLELVFGYNGLGRISGGSGPGGGGAGFSGAAGVLRLFNGELGGQISWLLPASVISLAAAVATVARRRPARTDRVLTTVVLWGGWLLVTALVYSFMSGTIHPYYTNTLAPPIAVLYGVGVTLLWRRREQLAARLTLGAMLLATGAWAFALLDRTPTWHPWLRIAVLLGALVVSAAIIVRGRALSRRAAASLAGVAAVIALAAPAAFTLSAVASAQAGSNPSAGPVSDARAGFGARGGPDGAGALTRTATALLTANASHYAWIAASASAQTASRLELATGNSVMALGGFTGSDSAITLARFQQLVAAGKIHYYVSGGSGAAAGSAGAAGSGGDARGGFAAPRGAPGATGGAGGPGMGGGVTKTIESWVAQHFTARTVGGLTVYDLTQRTS